MRAVQRHTKAGLEIGTMDFLLGKCKRVGDSSDRAVRSILRDVFTPRLTDAGRRALDSGSMTFYVSEGPRERFRNPGAHARFVSLKQAAECRDHVTADLMPS